MYLYDKFYADGFHDGNLKASIQKVVRMDRYTYDTIDNFDGIGFSDKLREYVRVMEVVRCHPDFNRLYDESVKVCNLRRSIVHY